MQWQRLLGHPGPRWREEGREPDGAAELGSHQPSFRVAES